MAIEWVTQSPEHYFLNTFETLRKRSDDWIIARFCFSSAVAHAKLIDNPDTITTKLRAMQSAGRSAFEEIKNAAFGEMQGYGYYFRDGDIILLAKIADETEKKTIQDIYRTYSDKNKSVASHYDYLRRCIRIIEDLAEKKLLSSKKIDAYEVLGDPHKRASMKILRKNREIPVVLVVEDDRFTAAYAANILNKDYELLLAKTGEEAIKAYVENAPDMVFLDIHLPGLSGHDTLQAIKTIDPKAIVVMLSADAVKPNIVNANKLGANGFLKKPFSKERLLSVVKSCVVMKDSSRDPPPENFH